LAEQIAVEAKKITRETSVKVQVAVGGNSKRAMLRQMQFEGCHLLVATPGRLIDLLTDPYSKVSAAGLTTLVLDEADRMLDLGFSEAVAEIQSLLPDIRSKDRQTLLFSATIPRDVMHMVRQTLKPGYQFVQTIQEGEAATHEKIPQKLVTVAGFENIMPTLLELSKREVEKNAQSPSTTMPFKAIVYFGSTANVELAGQIFKNLGSSHGGRHPLWPTEISMMHGKLTQGRREHVSERFRRAKSAILFSSDVTARGMDFPNVTHVIQVGLPPTKDQYVHRLGRTGRGDKPGEGWLIVPEFEFRGAKALRRLYPIVPDTSLQAATVDMTRDAQLPADLASTLSQVADATKMVARDTKETAFLAAIGASMVHADDKVEMMDTLNQWTRFGWGWEAPPSIPRIMADKMGLSKIKGVVIGQRSRNSDSEALKLNSFGRYPPRDRDSGARGGFGGGGGVERGYSGGFGGSRERSSYGRDRGFGSRDDRAPKAPRQRY
jgi:ATP-dependent RNA helicase MSS116